MNNIYKFFTVVIVVLQLTACENYLEQENPKDQINNDNVFTDDRLATSALVNVYSSMRNNGFFSGTVDGYGFLMSCLSDDLEVVNTLETDYRSFYQGSFTSSTRAVSSLWSFSYKQIFIVNNVLEGLNSNNAAVSENISNQLKGEALAVRGILHFYLTQTYGAVPYVTGTDYNINKQIGKTNTAVAMQKAIDDLKAAEELLTEVYPNAEKTRINKYVVQAFLARMNLYQENWAMAKRYAQMLIENPMYELDALDKVFLKGSKSAIWQFKPVVEGANALEGGTYIFTTLPAPFAKISVELLNSFENGDLRRASWIKEVQNDQNTHAYKYKLPAASATSQEYSVVIRLEEMYLIAAEAYAELNDFENFNDRLNILRRRAGLEDVNANSKSSAIELIIKERRVELFCEYGHRFLDLKRRNRLDMLAAVKPNWQPYFNLLPLPENELLLNPNLTPQNQGY